MLQLLRCYVHIDDHSGLHRMLPVANTILQTSCYTFLASCFSNSMPRIGSAAFCWQDLVIPGSIKAAKQAHSVQHCFLLLHIQGCVRSTILYCIYYKKCQIKNHLKATRYCRILGRQDQNPHAVIRSIHSHYIP